MTTTVYSGRVTNWLLFWTVNLIVAALAVVAVSDRPARPGLLGAAVVVLLVNLTMTSLRTTAGPDGVTVHYGVLGLPRFRYRVATIERADAVDLPLTRIGGLGVHWSPWRGTRLTIRTGPQLELHLRTGRTVTISVADPQAAAAVINAGER